MLAEVALVSLAIGWAWTNVVEPFFPRLRKRTLILPSLPPALQGATILHLSDLHVRKMGQLERRVIKLLQPVKADIAVLTGDLVDAESGIAPLLGVLSHVQVSSGVYAVWGNAEHKPSKLSDPSLLRTALETIGVTILNNRAIALTLNGVDLWVAGVDDPHSGHANLSQIMPSSHRVNLHLLLAHSPDILRDPLSAAFDLILCGHTHCGQIRLPGLGALWSHARLGRWVGEYTLTPELIARKLNRSLPQPHVLVSAGIATVGSPLMKMRLLCPPEVTLIELQATPSVPTRIPWTAFPDRDT